ncbi:hypothetical protein BGZ65_012667 [Modicella reniformis]|uniref:Uncharacterized protein n=1 Tax=Modicella reniformis TaxID=1440133 RepID=A0A9P6JER1_9FUNG|nr:hypothetical protein BGZ65_012667 [Modicella reniformis]
MFRTSSRIRNRDSEMRYEFAIRAAFGFPKSVSLLFRIRRICTFYNPFEGFIKRTPKAVALVSMDQSLVCAKLGERPDNQMADLGKDSVFCNMPWRFKERLQLLMMTSKQEKTLIMHTISDNGLLGFVESAIKVYEPRSFVRVVGFI